MSIEIVKSSSKGAKYGKIIDDVLKKFVEIIGDYVIKTTENLIEDIRFRQRQHIESKCFDNGDKIVYCFARVSNDANFCSVRINLLSSGILYSSRIGNQEHECIQIIVDSDLFEYINAHKDLQEELNAVYPDLRIKIKCELFECYLHFIISDIKIENQQRLSVADLDQMRTFGLV